MQQKLNLKEQKGIDTSTPASKTDFANMKTKVDNSDVDKVKTVPAQVYRARKQKAGITTHMDPTAKPNIGQVSTLLVLILVADFVYVLRMVAGKFLIPWKNLRKYYWKFNN